MSKIKLLAGLLILLPSMAVATVTHVTLWEALPGKSAEMMATAAKAVELNKKLGMQAVTAVDSRGRLHFAMAFEDWAQWGYTRPRLLQMQTCRPLCKATRLTRALCS